MANIIYGGMNVDQRFAASFEPNIYHEAWMIPNVTYSAQYQTGAAGCYQVHKLKKQSIIEPGKPGRDFSHVNAQDDLISIYLNNNFQHSRKMYGVTTASIEANAAEELMADTAKLARESINGAGLAALVNEGTTLAVGEITAENVKDVILGARANLSAAGASTAKVIVASPTTYSAFLAAAGKDFVTARNDIIQGTGVIRDWYGFTIVEASQLGGTYKYYDYTDTLKTVDTANVGFVMYDWKAFSALTNLEVFRLLDGNINFNGVVAQAEINQGYRVTNPDLVCVATV